MGSDAIKTYGGVGKRQTPQREQADPRQVPNSAGGWGFKVDPFQQLERFLVLGVTGGTYYVGEQALLKENAAGIQQCVELDGPKTIGMIRAISEEGRAVKNDPAIFALAVAASTQNPDAQGNESAQIRALALAALPVVCRIPTHLFHFAAFVENFRGWGRSLRRAIGNWYGELPVGKLAYEVVKYQSRDGWSNRDLLRLAHPKTTDPQRNAIYKWIVDGEMPEGIPAIIPASRRAFEQKGEIKAVVEGITTYGLTREMIPTEALTSPEVWEALLEKMPLTAMIRNLGVMTSVGVVAPLSAAAKTVVARLGDRDYLLRSRIHPLSVLVALKTYAEGTGERGKTTWKPVSQVIDALDEAFYLTFRNVEPTGKRMQIACDISGSMTCGRIGGLPLTPIEAVGALALVTANVETDYIFTCFATEFSLMNLSPRMRLDTVVKKMSAIGMGGTDCALPMLAAIEKEWELDAFVVLTDNETWAGRIHPYQALKRYREKSGIPAKLVVNGMTATKVSIADPADPGTLDVVGFDTTTPQVMSTFIR